METRPVERSRKADNVWLGRGYMTFQEPFGSSEERLIDTVVQLEMFATLLAPPSRVPCRGLPGTTSESAASFHLPLQVLWLSTTKLIRR